MGVPADVEVVFAAVAEAAAQVGAWEADPRTRDRARRATSPRWRRSARSRRRCATVNVGGVHFRPGRTERLRFVYLTDEEAAALRALAATGVSVTAQDVPTAAPVPLEAFT